MPSSLERAIDSARDAWLANITTADPKWALRQLHHLHDLLLENRDELINALVSDYSLPSITHERELALVVEDIAALIKLAHTDSTKPGPTTKTRYGTIAEVLLPRGVSLIASKSDNPLRFAIAPLAASIAARNTVVLVALEGSEFINVLRTCARKYLDCLAIHIEQEDELEFETEAVDHILVVDDDEAKWSSTLASPNAFWAPTTGGHNLAVINEGSIDAKVLAELIMTAYDPSHTKGDVLSAVLVHKENMAAITGALSRVCGRHISSLPANADDFEQKIYTVELSDVKSMNFREQIQFARESGALLLVESTSLDQMIDSIRKIHNVKQLILLGPASKAADQYLQTWTRSTVFATGSILPMTPSFIQLPGASGRAVPQTSFPPSFFCQHRLIVSGRNTIPRKTIEDVRKSYHAMVSPLKPDHPGGRIDFFVQVGYAFKAAKYTIGTLGLVGLIFGGRWAQRRFL